MSESEGKIKDRKAYMNEYYKTNKKKVLSSSLAKEICKYCERSVAHQQIQKHIHTEYCKKRRLQNMTILKEMQDKYKNIELIDTDESDEKLI